MRKQRRAICDTGRSRKRCHTYVSEACVYVIMSLFVRLQANSRIIHWNRKYRMIELRQQIYDWGRNARLNKAKNRGLRIKVWTSCLFAEYGCSIYTYKESKLGSGSCQHFPASEPHPYLVLRTNWQVGGASTEREQQVNELLGNSEVFLTFYAEPEKKNPFSYYTDDTPPTVAYCCNIFSFISQNVS